MRAINLRHRRPSTRFVPDIFAKGRLENKRARGGGRIQFITGNLSDSGLGAKLDDKNAQIYYDKPEARARRSHTGRVRWGNSTSEYNIPHVHFSVKYSCFPEVTLYHKFMQLKIKHHWDIAIKCEFDLAQFKDSTSSNVVFFSLRKVSAHALKFAPKTHSS